MNEICGVCGAPVNTGDRFCGECGHVVVASAESPTETLTRDRAAPPDSSSGWIPGAGRAGATASPAETTVARSRPPLLPDAPVPPDASPSVGKGAWVAVAVSVFVFVALIVTIVVVLMANQDDTPAADSSNAESQYTAATDEEPVGDARPDLDGGTSSDLGRSTTTAPTTAPPTTAPTTAPPTTVAAWRSWISLETHPSTIRNYPCRQMLAHGVPYDFVVDYFQKWDWFYLQEGGGGMDQDDNGKPCEGQFPSESAQYDPANDYAEAS